MEPAATDLGYWEEVVFAAIGVVLSVLLPFLLALVKKYWPGGSALATWKEYWNFVLPYVVLGIFSLGVAIVVAAAADFASREAALMAGFAWDKTLEVAAHVWRPTSL